jgi:hypothetical protein
VADGRLEGLFTSLNAGFEAAVARDEEEAASDLAFSLLQDRSLTEALVRARAPFSVRTMSGQLVEVAEVGADYVAVGAPVCLLIPTKEAVFFLGVGSKAPSTSSGSFIDLLRRWARAGTSVEVGTIGLDLVGRLERAGRDHLLVRTRTGDVVIALEAVRWIRSARGG